MDLPDSLQRALDRLSGALDGLEAAALRRAEAEAARAALPDDRARLAAERDAALARSRALDRAVGEVALRVDRAAAAVRGALSELAPPPGAA